MFKELRTSTKKKEFKHKLTWKQFFHWYMCLSYLKTSVYICAYLDICVIWYKQIYFSHSFRVILKIEFPAPFSLSLLSFLSHNHQVNTNFSGPIWSSVNPCNRRPWFWALTKPYTASSAIERQSITLHVDKITCLLVAYVRSALKRKQTFLLFEVYDSI